MKVDELGNPNSDVIADFVEHNQNIIAAQKAIPLNRDGLTAYFDQMATDGKVETTVEWLVDISLLIQDDVTKRLATAEGIPQADGWVAIETVEDLPKEEGLRCLVTRRGHVELLVWCDHYKSWDDATGDDHECDAMDVTAWQPLPAPYQRPSSEGE
jgi:hypothetical protein